MLLTKAYDTMKAENEKYGIEICNCRKRIRYMNTKNRSKEILSQKNIGGMITIVIS